MELSGAGGFYTLAELAMAFAGFTAIVVVLRQSAGKPLSQTSCLVHERLCRTGADGLDIRHDGSSASTMQDTRDASMENIKRTHARHFSALALFCSISQKKRRPRNKIASSIFYFVQHRDDSRRCTLSEHDGMAA